MDKIQNGSFGNKESMEENHPNKKKTSKVDFITRKKLLKSEILLKISFFFLKF